MFELYDIISIYIEEIFKDNMLLTMYIGSS